MNKALIYYSIPTHYYKQPNQRTLIFSYLSDKKNCRLILLILLVLNNNRKPVVARLINNIVNYEWLTLLGKPLLPLISAIQL